MVVCKGVEPLPSSSKDSPSWTLVRESGILDHFRRTHLLLGGCEVIYTPNALLTRQCYVYVLRKSAYNAGALIIKLHSHDLAYVWGIAPQPDAWQTPMLTVTPHTHGRDRRTRTITHSLEAKDAIHYTIPLLIGSATLSRTGVRRYLHVKYQSLIDDSKPSMLDRFTPWHYIFIHTYIIPKHIRYSYYWCEGRELNPHTRCSSNIRTSYTNGRPIDCLYPTNAHWRE